MKLVTVARTDDIAEGEVRAFASGGAAIAVFHAASGFHACKNVCPHRGGPVAEGDFDGRIVTCPWHGWQFDVSTGVNVLMPAARLEMCTVEVHGGDVQVAIE